MWYWEPIRMQIISHRGFWLAPEEKNSETAFRRSFRKGFGTETDIRDYRGRLCISHDMPTSEPMPVEQLFDIYVKYDQTLPLFLNIKSEGIGEALRKVLDEYAIKNYFAFDMSVPEMIYYKKKGLLDFITRMSDVETIPILIEDSKGIWIDNFFGHTLLPADINYFSSNDHLLCFVSPELHGRSHKGYWELLKAWEESNEFSCSQLILCTDFPEDAENHFNRGEGA